jgi:glucokinase
MKGNLTLGIDLGGTQLRAAVIDQSGELLRRAAVATDVAGGPNAIIPQMVKLFHEVGEGLKDRIVAAGVSSPGPLDLENGRTTDLPTLPGWHQFPLRETLREKLELPVVLENDGVAAANGEWKFGAGRGLKNLVYVTVSTGIGGGVVVDGHLMHGRRGMAGHVGHMMVDPEGPICGCGGRGCIEGIASATAFGAAARRSGFVDGKHAVAAARSGDVKALALLDNEATWLGYAFASLLHLYSPEILIVGGGLSSALDLMSDGIRNQLNRNAMPAFREIQVVPAALGDNAGLIGAAALAMDII